MGAIYSNGGYRWNILGFNFNKRDALSSVYTAISIKVVPRAKRKSRIRARKAAGNRFENSVHGNILSLQSQLQFLNCRIIRCMHYLVYIYKISMNLTRT